MVSPPDLTTEIDKKMNIPHPIETPEKSHLN